MAAVDAWDPAQYHRFRDERRRPFDDLVALLRPTPGGRVVDLGCGTGELTLALHHASHARETVGIDASEAMLEQARTHATPGLRFERGDIATFEEPEAWDVVFANASLQWVDRHDELLARLRRCLRPAGQLAVQVPANHDHASRTVAAEVAGDPPFGEALQGHVRRSPVLPAEDYSVLLHRLGFRAQHVRLQVYLHVMDDAAAVVEWVKGTLLTDYRRRLPPELYDAFLERYRERLLQRLGDERPYPYAFKRILFHAAR